MQWKVSKRKTVFDGFLKLTSYEIEHDLFNGGTQVINRELLERGHAAAVMPYDAVSDSVLLIQQFRVGAMHTDQSPWLLEFVAGMVETGESGEDVVRREAQEEAGIDLDDIHYISTYYPSPGGSTETIEMYWANADLTNAGGVFGLDSECEDIKATVVAFDDAIAMLDRGEINNSVTMLLLLWFYRYKASL